MVAKALSPDREAHLAEAASLYRGILAQTPQNAEALNLLGGIEAQRNDPSAAIALIDRAIALQPKNAAFVANRGNVLAQQECFEDALASYDRALAIKPDYVLVLNNRGLVLRELKRFEDALQSIDKALAIKPDYAEALNNRGLVLRELKRFEDALESIDKALALKPDLPNAAINREMALLGLRRLTRHPPLATRALFDEFSSHYDKTMLELLDYRGHIHVRTLADRVLPHLARPWNVLDLGMGTGLVGGAFKDLTAGGRLDGIDLAPRMIEAARARGIYDLLILGDLESVLAQPGPSYDLILSADTMTYLGDLMPTFSGVVQHLVPGGFYIFACERKDGEGWEQTPSNRFRHSQAYMRAEAAHAGLEFAGIMECCLRSQAHEPVPGFAVALRKPDGIAPPVN